MFHCAQSIFGDGLNQKCPCTDQKTMSDEERGVRPKDRSLRMKQPVDYKRLHEGTGHVDPTLDRIMRSGSKTVLGSPGGSLEEDVMGIGAVSAAGSELGHESVDKSVT